MYLKLFIFSPNSNSRCQATHFHRKQRGNKELQNNKECLSLKPQQRDYLWIVYYGVWAQFHAQRKYTILSRKLARFATPVTTNIHACCFNSSTPSLKIFRSTTMNFITLHQHVTETGNGLKIFHPSGLVGGTMDQCPAELDCSWFCHWSSRTICHCVSESPYL